MMALGLPALVVAMFMLEANAVFLFTRTVIESVEQIVFDEKGKGTEDGAAIDGWQQSFEVGHGKSVVEGLDGLPDHDTHGSGSYVMILQMLGYIFIHCVGIFS